MVDVPAPTSTLSATRDLTSPAGSPVRARPRLIVEVVIVAAFYTAYSLTRDAVPAHQWAALGRAWSVLNLETRLHVNLEYSVNQFVAGNHLLSLFAGYWYMTMHFVITLAVLLWLWFRHPERYIFARTALMATNLIALAVFWLYPLAPPRMLWEAGFIDTVARDHIWGTVGSAGMSSASNQFAAMPSLHIGWAVWCATAVFLVTRNRLARALAVLYPMITLFVILGTANHFLIDAAAGALTCSLGWIAAQVIYGVPVLRLSPARLDFEPAALDFEPAT